jgi:hypothetical protein
MGVVIRLRCAPASLIGSRKPIDASLAAGYLDELLAFIRKDRKRIGELLGDLARGTACILLDLPQRDRRATDPPRQFGAT